MKAAQTFRETSFLFHKWKESDKILSICLRKQIQFCAFSVPNCNTSLFSLPLPLMPSVSHHLNLSRWSWTSSSLLIPFFFSITLFHLALNTADCQNLLFSALSCFGRFWLPFTSADIETVTITSCQNSSRLVYLFLANDLSYFCMKLGLPGFLVLIIIDFHCNLRNWRLAMKMHWWMLRLLIRYSFQKCAHLYSSKFCFRINCGSSVLLWSVLN